MPSATEFRRALRDHLGVQRFHEFLQRGTQPRLRFWQEKALEQFFLAHPEHRISLLELEAALRFCEVHEIELQLGTVPVFHGNLDYSPTYLQQRQTLFPHAGVDPISTAGVSSSKREEPFWFCPECRTRASERRG